MLTLKKSLGQHFLHDENICRKIVEQVTRKEGLQLVEVGPGGGALTKYLLAWEDVRYKAIEVDDEKVTYLNAQYPAIKDKLVHIDFLKAAVPFEGQFSVIGNFPYNISSQILFKILDWENQVDEVIGMFQKEVALRVAAPSGNKAYGILSVLIQAFFKVEYLFDVHENCFTPPPKVKSGVIRLSNAQNPFGIEDRKTFTRIVKAAFGQRRKMLRNALKGTFSAAILEEPIFTKRAEQLSVADFVGLYQRYLKQQHD
ncbi:16S rRNA (adenine(1518)-N(6)/adenine(1519)-N(6))-dimethyltransferase RsmA [Taibaiella chishuiensis]|uniref:Ribosomal RNA small subunit methyltransferase A n=1 Tax=Taibaiella chishuiensis TaxID=1434707 RepID=A0A2P8DC68_9BACT|nr:16S rRNA (adenine(1518)-N(6)/adenine(1519)-N(6))-dimethyltransferase RsmA [Taibaiella chishuiensis]PSK94799.1 16S rRNA (adenine1518-N6/adenine1519-N6)-dimethyltransferase [Taibaiella chishuiensis]